MMGDSEQPSQQYPAEAAWQLPCHQELPLAPATNRTDEKSFVCSIVSCIVSFRFMDTFFLSFFFKYSSNFYYGHFLMPWPQRLTTSQKSHSLVQSTSQEMHVGQSLGTCQGSECVRTPAHSTDPGTDLAALPEVSLQLAFSWSVLSSPVQIFSIRNGKTAEKLHFQPGPMGSKSKPICSFLYCMFNKCQGKP